MRGCAGRRAAGRGSLPIPGREAAACFRADVGSRRGRRGGVPGGRGRGLALSRGAGSRGDRGKASREGRRRSPPGLALRRGWRPRSWALREVDREKGRTHPRARPGKALGAGCRGAWEGGRGAGGCVQTPATRPGPHRQREGPAVRSPGPAVGPSPAVGPPAPGAGDERLAPWRGGRGERRPRRWCGRREGTLCAPQRPPLHRHWPRAWSPTITA